MARNLEKLSDEELVEIVKEGGDKSGEAFSEIYSRYAPKAYAFCRRFFVDDRDVNDAFQETFMKFHEAIKNGASVKNIAPFILTIARNNCLNAVRKKKPSTTFEEFMAIANDRKYEENEIIDLVKTGIELLPPKYKEAIILKEYDGLSYKEISETTGLTIGQVKIRLYRAKQALRKFLSPYIKEIVKEDKL